MVSCELSDSGVTGLSQGHVTVSSGTYAVVEPRVLPRRKALSQRTPAERVPQVNAHCNGDRRYRERKETQTQSLEGLERPLTKRWSGGVYQLGDVLMESGGKTVVICAEFSAQ